MHVCRSTTADDSTPTFGVPDGDAITLIDTDATSRGDALWNGASWETLREGNPGDRVEVDVDIEGIPALSNRVDAP